ncbi:MAG: hypothetical protein U1B83_01255, partial [Candidatus Cloacimonadaceae bacterium]|nr:hypothetical protein [Candidatus Cloacimonadaceae bacterium]
MKIEAMKPVEILQRLIQLKSSNQSDLEDPEEAASANATTKKQTAQASGVQRQIAHLIKHPQFLHYQLSARDAMVIADLWNYHLEYTGHTSGFSSLCQSARLDQYRVSECLDYVSGLIERHIICFDEKITGNYYLNPLILQSGEFTLCKSFVLRIMGRDLSADIELGMQAEWHEDQDFLRDLRLVFDLCYHSFGEYGSRSPVLEYPILSLCLELLRQRIHRAPDSLGIKALVKRYSLEEIQLNIILIVLYHQLHSDERITEEELIQSLAP